MLANIPLEELSTVTGGQQNVVWQGRTYFMDKLSVDSVKRWCRESLPNPHRDCAQVGVTASAPPERGPQPVDVVPARVAPARRAGDDW